MKPTTLLLSAVLIAFTTWSVWLVGFDYGGFLELARREPWGAQITVNLVIACSIATGWMLRDARTRGINALPYALATVALGSIGLLAYLVHRSATAPRAGRAIGAPSAA